MEAELKSMETEFGGNRMVAFILSWQRAEHSSLMPQELHPRCMRSPGLTEDEEQR